MEAFDICAFSIGLVGRMRKSWMPDPERSETRVRLDQRTLAGEVTHPGQAAETPPLGQCIADEVHTPAFIRLPRMPSSLPMHRHLSIVTYLTSEFQDDPEKALPGTPVLDLAGLFKDTPAYLSYYASAGEPKSNALIQPNNL